MRATTILGLVQRLLTHEAARAPDQTAIQDQTVLQDQPAASKAFERVLNKLRERLSKTIGQEGFRTLLARALTLTTSQFPHLSGIQIGPDGSLTESQSEVGANSRGVDPSEIADNMVHQDPNTKSRDIVEDRLRLDRIQLEASVALVAHLLALLVTFIGVDLTLRILSSVWPEFALDAASQEGNETLEGDEIS